MARSEAMTSPTHSFAYSHRLVKKCFVKTCTILKCYNILIFQKEIIKFSLFCSKMCTLSSEIKLNLFWSYMSSAQYFKLEGTKATPIGLPPQGKPQYLTFV